MSEARKAQFIVNDLKISSTRVSQITDKATAILFARFINFPFRRFQHQKISEDYAMFNASISPLITNHKTLITRLIECFSSCRLDKL